MGVVGFVFVCICLLRLILLSASSNCKDTLQLYHANPTLTYNCSTKCRSQCNRIKQVQVDLSIDQERRVFVNVSWLGNHSPEDVLEVTVKRARNDRNAKYCIPETEDYWCLVSDLHLSQEYFVRFSFSDTTRQICRLALLPLHILLPSTSLTPFSTDSEDNADGYIYTSTAPVVTKSFVQSSAAPPTTHSISETHPPGRDVDTNAKPTVINSLITFSTDQSTTRSVSEKHSSEIDVQAWIIIAVVVSVFYLVLAVAAIFVFSRRRIQHARSRSDPINNRFYVTSPQHCVSNVLPEVSREETDGKHDITMPRNASFRQENLPIVKVWLFFPTQQPSTTRIITQSLAKELNSAGIQCMCALHCESDIVTHTYDRVDMLIKSVDVVICCCNEDFHESWVRCQSIGYASDPDWVFYREYLYVNCELKNRRYRRLAVVLLEDARHRCVPECLQAVPQFRFPYDEGSLDLVNKIFSSAAERNVLSIIPTSSQDKLSPLETDSVVVEEKETEL